MCVVRYAAGIAFILSAAAVLGATAPGHEDAQPAGLTEVRIGYFGPADGAHPRAGDMWCAASMALDEANAAGGYHGLPFRFVAGWSENPWGTGVRDVTRMAYIHRVWAIIGGVDGPSTHLAEQVIAKARLVMLNPAASDKTINLANVPWMFSCVPPDGVQSRALARGMASKVRGRPFAVVSAVDHDSHLFTVELGKALKACGLQPAYHFQCDPQAGDYDALLETIASGAPAAVVIVADAQISAHLVTALRQRGYTGDLFGGPWMGTRAFREQAGDAACGVVFPRPCATSTGWSWFESDFRARFGRRPDYLAAHTYDAVTLLVAAIRQGGLDRTRIREAVRDLSPWQGVSGEIVWNAAGANVREVSLGTWAAGRVQPLPEPVTPDDR